MKPGRKFVEESPAACTDAELLAILIGSGGTGYSALDVARNLLEHFGNLSGLMGHDLSELTEIKGVKAVRAIRIAAAFELSRRIIRELEERR
jgi:DNA repair protein RadC